jgi:hypothetical protein
LAPHEEFLGVPIAREGRLPSPPSGTTSPTEPSETVAFAALDMTILAAAGATLSLSAAVHLNVLNSSYDPMHL